MAPTETLPSCHSCHLIKLRTALGKFGECWAHIAYFGLAFVGRNHFVNIKFTKLSKQILDPTRDRFNATAHSRHLLRAPQNICDRLRELRGNQDAGLRNKSQGTNIKWEKHSTCQPKFCPALNNTPKLCTSEEKRLRTREARSRVGDFEASNEGDRNSEMENSEIGAKILHREKKRAWMWNQEWGYLCWVELWAQLALMWFISTYARKKSNGDVWLIPEGRLPNIVL